MVNAPSLAKAAGVTTSFTTGNSSNIVVTVSGEGDNMMTMTGCACGDKTFLTGNHGNIDLPSITLVSN